MLSVDDAVTDYLDRAEKIVREKKWLYIHDSVRQEDVIEVAKMLQKENNDWNKGGE